MNISPFLSINHPCGEVLPWVMKQLLQTDLRPIQTFDLHDARLATQDCSCPHHGTSTCDCQMVVLLVYGETTEPVTLILHGNDGRTWISIANDSQKNMNAIMTASIQQALEVKGPISISSVE